nr:PREDICTED: apolipoprotein D-like [Paralichthys olivaceus]
MSVQQGVILLSLCLSQGKTRTGEGTAVVRDPREAAKLGVSFSYFTPYSPYWVLSTDYTNFTIVYSCNDVLRLFHIDFAWILSRSRFMPQEKVQQAKHLMISEGIDLSRMKATDQTGCKDD